ncbi:MAG TPA: hypothetical protein VG944_09520, partial [Fimbriimonas sp.]|nr:hypothetical protein [Fimbriimonas sp.]
GTVLRATASQGPLLSHQVLGPEIRKDVAARLAGHAVQFRDDLPLKIDDVSQVQVDTSVQESPGTNGAASPLAPPQDFELKAQVIGGKPVATAQVADLPDPIRTPIEEDVKKAISANPVRDLNGQSKSLQNVGSLQILIQLKANGPAPNGATILPGTPLKRSFDATLRIDSPPSFLIDALKAADRAGKAITVRVELKTSSKPIAFVLLKKS